MTGLTAAAISPFDPGVLRLALPGLLAGLLVAVACAVLGVLVVLKRLAFIGQGISHAVFGGVGLGLVLGLSPGLEGAFGLDLLVLGFSIAAALGISLLSRARRTGSDTAIGIVLAVCMAAGFMLHRAAGAAVARAGRARPLGLEDVLFGSVLEIGPAEAWFTAGAVAAAGLLVLLHRRSVMFWAFDEQTCVAFGVDARRAQTVLLTALAVIVVVATKVAGVVLAGGLLVLPAAAALAVATRLAAAVALSVGVALGGMAGGIALSFGANLQPGPSVVVVLAALFGVSLASRRLLTRHGRSPV